MSDLQRRLQLALEAAHMAIWDSHIVNGKVAAGTVNWSGDGAALLGLPPRPLRHAFHQFLAMVHRDDRERVVATLQDGVERRGTYHLEYRVLWPDGTLRWLAAKAQVFCDANGVPERTLGIIWDVTERTLNDILIAINRAMVKAINEVGHVMGLQTVAEYVEDEATLAVVRELGIDYAQGYAVGNARAQSRHGLTAAGDRQIGASPRIFRPFYAAPFLTKTCTNHHACTHFSLLMGTMFVPNCGKYC